MHALVTYKLQAREGGGGGGGEGQSVIAPCDSCHYSDFSNTVRKSFCMLTRSQKY